MKHSDGRTERTFSIMHKFNARSAQRIMEQTSRTVVIKTQISLLK